MPHSLMRNYQTHVSAAELGGVLSSYDSLVHFMSTLTTGAMGREELFLITALSSTWIYANEFLPHLLD